MECLRRGEYREYIGNMLEYIGNAFLGFRVYMRSGCVLMRFMHFLLVFMCF